MQWGEIQIDLYQPPNVREAPVALLEKSAPDNTGVLQTYKQKMVKIRSSTHAKQ